MAQFDLSSIYTSDKYTSVLDLLKKLINNIDGVQYVDEDELSSLSSTVSGHTTSISTLNTDYNALNSTVSGHTTSIGSLNTSVGKNTTDISNLKDSVSNIHTTYYNHNICILFDDDDININVSITMLSTTSDEFNVDKLSDTLSAMLVGGKYLNCLCLYKDLSDNSSNIYSAITIAGHFNIGLGTTHTADTITFDMSNATITDTVTPIV